MADVFISYASKDEDFARKLANGLVEKGLSVWLPEQNLKLGDDWAEESDQAIKESRNTLVVLSEHSARSDRVRTETALALTQSGKRVVPVYSIKGVEVPFMLRSKQGVDLSYPASYLSSIERLANLLKEKENQGEDEKQSKDRTRLLRTELDRFTLELEKSSLHEEAMVKARVLTLIVATSTILTFLGAVLLLFLRLPDDLVVILLAGFIGVLTGVAGTMILRQGVKIDK